MREGGGWHVGQQIREGAEAVGGRLREGYDSAREGIGRGYRRAAGGIARNPAPSVLISFGIGFGLGVVLVSLLGREEEIWAERNIPDRIRRVPESVSESVRETVKNVPDQVHHLAEAIAGYLPRAIRRRLG
jgi:hypothetical protein